MGRHERRREFTATVYVLNGNKDALLFVRRTKPPFLGYFLPPGGHLEGNETPDEAALREVKEETGYSIRLLSLATIESIEEEGVQSLAYPIAIQLEPIDEVHDHVDFVYLGQVLEGERQTGEVEDEGIWLSAAQLDGYPLPSSIRASARKIFLQVCGMNVEQSKGCVDSSLLFPA